MKILDGIAGSGKSSKLHKIFSEAGIDYGRYTSTNKLKRDAIDRYGGHCDTIAGGLFHTEDGVFFLDDKDTEYGLVVIDEVLQTNKKVLQWAEKYRERTNIFLLTDTRQMLAPKFGETFLRAFEDFKKRDFVDVVSMQETLRARDNKTKTIYEDCYKSVAAGQSLYYQHSKTMKHIPFSQLLYTPGDVYITHNNDDEKRMYQRFHLSERYELDLIPKGTIARGGYKDISRYPIIPQSDVAAKLHGYFQIANVGTPTRYQGSECRENQTLYYLVQRNARVEAREWYTVVTRSYLFDNIVIVDMPTIEQEPLKVYFGVPVKECRWYSIDADAALSTGDKLADIVGADAKPRIEDGYIKEALRNMRDTEDVHYRDGGFFFDGRLVLGIGDGPKDAPAISMPALLAKEPCFKYSYMPSIYRRYEETQRAVLKGRYSYTPFGASLTIGAKNTYKYGLDLNASYPHILAYADLPIDGDFVVDEAAPGYKLYAIANSELVPYGAIIGGGALNELYAVGDIVYPLYLGTVPYKTGSMMGKRLLSMATDTVESNNERKNVWYGVIEKPYILEAGRNIAGIPTGFYLEPSQNKAPLIWAIKSKQAELMLKIYGFLFGTNTKKARCTADCLFFNYFGDLNVLGDEIRRVIPEYDFRIFDVKSKDVLYKTYKDLPTRDEKKKARDRKNHAQS